jgi:hypothetical protein
LPLEFPTDRFARHRVPFPREIFVRAQLHFPSFRIDFSIPRSSLLVHPSRIWPDLEKSRFQRRPKGVIFLFPRAALVKISLLPLLVFIPPMKIHSVLARVLLRVPGWTPVLVSRDSFSKRRIRLELIVFSVASVQRQASLGHSCLIFPRKVSRFCFHLPLLVHPEFISPPPIKS